MTKRCLTILTLAAAIFLGMTAMTPPARCQNSQAELLLDLKKARAAYDSARQKLESDRTLFDKQAISEQEYNQSENQLLTAEVEYQKLILRVISEQSYIIVEKAVKYQTPGGERRV